MFKEIGLTLSVIRTKYSMFYLFDTFKEIDKKLNKVIIDVYREQTGLEIKNIDKFKANKDEKYSSKFDAELDTSKDYSYKL